MKHYKLLSLALAFTLLFSLAACKPAAGEPTAVPTPEGTQAPTAQPTEEPSAAPTETPSSVEHPDIRLAVLSGPTGIGGAVVHAVQQLGRDRKSVV